MFHKYITKLWCFAQEETNKKKQSGYTTSNFKGMCDTWITV